MTKTLYFLYIFLLFSSISYSQEHLFSKKLEKHYDYLAPDGSEIRLLINGKRGGLCHYTLKAQKISKAVKNQTVEELWFVLEGKGKLWRKLGDEEKIIELEKGISFNLPAQTHFQVKNTEDNDLKALITTMPPWPGSQDAASINPYWQ